MVSVIGVYGQRKMLVLLLLGFSSGLPSLLVGQVLQAWLTGAGVDISTIGYFSLVALPYAAKPLWAPFLDRYCVPWAGRRRSWLFFTQTTLLLAIAVLSTQNPTSGMSGFIAAAVAVAFCSASQDIVVDAYRADVLQDHEVGAGSASYVTGFRIAAVLGSWLPLAMAEHMSWSATYLAMTAFLAVGLIGTLYALEPPVPAGLPKGFAAGKSKTLSRRSRSHGNGRACTRRLNAALRANLPVCADFSEYASGEHRGDGGSAALIRRRG